MDGCTLGLIAAPNFGMASGSGWGLFFVHRPWDIGDAVKTATEGRAMASERIKVDRNYHNGVEITFTDRQGFVAVEYLTTAEAEELVEKIQGTWKAQQLPVSTEERERLSM